MGERGLLRGVAKNRVSRYYQRNTDSHIMNISEEIQKLKELHESGALTDDEFAQAKARLLGGSQEDVKSTEESDKTPEPHMEEVEKFVLSKSGGFNWVYPIGAIILVIGLVFIFSGKKAGQRNDESNSIISSDGEKSKPEKITVALDLQLYSPSHVEIGKLINKHNAITSEDLVNQLTDYGISDFFNGKDSLIPALMKRFIGDQFLPFAFLPDGDTAVYVVARVEGSNIGYTDAVRRVDFFGRSVGISIDLPIKYIGRKINVEIWDDDSDEQGVKKFFESLKAKADGELDGRVGGKASFEKTPLGGPSGEVHGEIGGRVGGTLEFDFKNFSQVLNNKDDLITSVDFTLEPDIQISRAAPFLQMTQTKSTLSSFIRKENIDKFVSEATSKGLLIETFQSYHLPCGSVKIKFFLK